MGLLGIHLTVRIGPTVPVPLPAPLLESLESVEVTHNDEKRSGFQIVFQVGRGPADLVDYAPFTGPLLKPFSRVILMVTFGVFPQVLMDGIITNQQFAPGTGPGQSKLTLTGEDVSVVMDREERNVEHPAQNETVIAAKLIGAYSELGLVPVVFPTPILDVPLPTDRVPVQCSTDLQHLQEMAKSYDYVFYIIPGPAPGTNLAYWGPPVRTGGPQPALSYNLGPTSNVDSIDFQHNALDATAVSGQVQDRTTNQTVPVPALPPSRPPLAAEQPDLLNPSAGTRRRLLRASGLTATEAVARAQAMTDASVKETVTATGELNALFYGGILQARALVGLRGAGRSYDGTYYVKSVTHSIAKGAYKQKFTLTREGLGALAPVVRP